MEELFTFGSADFGEQKWEETGMRIMNKKMRRRRRMMNK
jgi:hypothetical protein